MGGRGKGGGGHMGTDMGGGSGGGGRHAMPEKTYGEGLMGGGGGGGGGGYGCWAMLPRYG